LRQRVEVEGNNYHAKKHYIPGVRERSLGGCKVLSSDLQGLENQGHNTRNRGTGLEI
jgi:hypothetical protein